MTAGHVVKTTVFAGAIVQSDPASQVRQGLRASPIRVVLVPGHHSAVLGRLAEQLIVPETHCAPEQLRGGHDECRAPQDVMECGFDSPCAQSVKQHCFRICRLVRVVLVEQRMPGVGLREQAGQLRPQNFHLPIVEQAHAGQIAGLAVGRNLLIAEAVLVPPGPALRPIKQFP